MCVYVYVCARYLGDAENRPIVEKTVTDLKLIGDKVCVLCSKGRALDIQVIILVPAYTHTHTHSHIYTCAHTYTHTHIHTFTQRI